MHANFYLQPRGPDVTNVDNTSLPGWTFLHNLLSITGARTTQPFVSEKSRRAAVFNGEIYNYQQLSRAGAVFASDGHAILPTHALFGASFVSQLHGEFALVLVDSFQTNTVQPPRLHNDGFEDVY